MAKKGKEKATAPPPAAVAASGSSKKSSSSKSGKNAPASQQNDDFIVFTNSTKESKSNKKGGGQGSTSNAGAAEASGPPKPTVKQIIGGASWTGKLPVNLLSEHCQRQKWDKPDYQSIRNSEGFGYFVQLSAKNPKTHEVQKLPPFKIPPDHKQLVTRETALEAKHAAATYALFRVCSMKNIHTTLPPDYKSLWKQFEELKKEDVKKGNAWMYDADPFATLKQREDEKTAAEKKRKEQEAIKEKAKNMPGAAGLVLRSNASSSSGGGGNPMKGWTTVPKIEMGRKTRSQLEDLLRREVIWNPHGVKMSTSQKEAIIKELTNSGFRKSHAEEAVDECKDREETLEWLLIHVPEDDLPRWALPESYSAGVSVAATQDLKREAAVKRLSQSGYSAELCRKLYDEKGGNEGLTAEALQHFLLSSGNDSELTNGTGEEPFISGTPEECWSDEMESLASVFGENFKRLSDDVCQIRIESVKNGPKNDVEAHAQFRKSPRYPAEIVVAVVADLPSYIKLSVVKKTLAYLRESLSEEPMKIYFAVDWIQQNINSIIENPGKLREISGVASTAAETRHVTPIQQRPSRHPKPLPRTVDMRSKEEWQRRQDIPAMKGMLAQRQKLPAWQAKDLVVDAVLQNQVTIIAGETGSGKSTQSVQFILDDLYSKGLGNTARIICTQPRRISALGLADRVSDERCSKLGQEVGYAIRGENKNSPQTKITFVTTGVLLRRLQTSGGKTEDVVASLADVSHIVIDEVHERSLDTDFLLSIIRDVLKRRKDLKLVLMSATLDAATFQSYFTSEGLRVGLVEIAGRTYPVEDYYLDDIIRMTGFSADNGRYRDRDEGMFDEANDQGSVDKGPQDPINKTIQRLGSRINYSLLVETAKAIDADLYQSNKKGGILIFLPGVAEINRTVNQLRAVSSLHVLPLHASLDTREQRRVFASPPAGKRKVVVATNVAETSITIDDIVAVIDTGKVKETSFDPQNNMRKLEETFASRAACKQRRGRAGRVQAGKCYKLYTRNLEERMAERPEPEIRRVPLEQLCLSVRAMGTRDVGGFLGRTPTPPAITAVENAIKMLQRMGALDGEELTALGQQLAMIPADLRCGKLMIYGAIFGCLDESVTIASILSTKSPFVSPPDKREDAKAARMKFSKNDGDLLTDLRAYQQWSTMEGTPQRQLRQFCDENFLSYQTLNDISATRTQYYSALAELGIRDNRPSSSQASPALVRALTASAFTPQIARIQFPDKKFATSMSGAVELDPEARTIKYFTQENGRVFIHPASTLHDSQGFPGGAAFMSYFNMMSTSKIFIRELTPFNAFTLLLFSGAIELDTMGRGLVVDGWLRLRGWARIGVLVSRLRGMVDNIIALKVNDPHADVHDNEVVRMVAKLIELDGLDA
ncbi:P-loop containing nucleoside triphosphate hydrolase protein [Hypomontagnella monticulosa]|nr:P-loop containing nucleoside triphosphate hydrolase protein [Hypomontagnella monticulosa]